MRNSERNQRYRFRQTTMGFITIASAAILLIGTLVPAGAVAKAAGDAADAVAKATGNRGDRAVHYFNSELQDDSDPNNDFRFGPDRYVAATAAVSSGNAVSVATYVANADGTGDLFSSIQQDPALCAAIALDMDETLLGFEEKILIDEQGVPVGSRADVAHLHFLRDDAYWERAATLIEQRLIAGKISIIQLDDYDSGAYMVPQGLEGNKPSVVVRRSSAAGGHFVEFSLGDHGTVRYRLECGYQPVDMTYWPAPKGKPPVVDNPGGYTPDNPPTPTPPPPGTGNPPASLEPKDPNAGPQVQGQGQSGYEDFGGGVNHNNDTTVTPEPSLPDSYVAPSAPTSSSGGGSGGAPSSPSPSSSGSVTVDQTNGTTETHNDTTYTVVSGDGQSHTDLQIVQEQHDSTTVEQNVSSDGTNSGDLDPSAVE